MTLIIALATRDDTPPLDSAEVDEEFARRGADAGLKEGRRVLALDPILRAAAITGLEEVVRAAAKRSQLDGATRDQTTWFAIAFRAGFDAAMRGRSSFELRVKMTPAVRH